MYRWGASALEVQGLDGGAGARARRGRVGWAGGQHALPLQTAATGSGLDQTGLEHQPSLAISCPRVMAVALGESAFREQLAPF